MLLFGVSASMQYCRAKYHNTMLETINEKLKDAFLC